MFDLVAPKTANRAPALEEHPADPFVERVVLATDGGPGGTSAMKWIAHRARNHRLDVDVSIVVEAARLTAQVRGGDSDEAADSVVTGAKRYLERVAPSAQVRGSVSWGDARERFARASQAADLLVVGGGGGGRLAGLLGGSFPVKLAESSECPTIVVPRSWTSGHGAVVVGVDADLEDQPALRFAVHEARVLHRRLRVVHCWQVPFVRTLAGVSPSSLAEAAARQTRALAGILERLRAEDTDLDIRGVVAEAHPADALSREAAGQEILVVGAHRRTAEERLFLGSTSREILARPPCPVAVVRARAI